VYVRQRPFSLICIHSTSPTLDMMTVDLLISWWTSVFCFGHAWTFNLCLPLSVMHHFYPFHSSCQHLKTYVCHQNIDITSKLI
jgi:hypothetical protein